MRDTVYAAAALTGMAGTGFHLFNISKKPSGFSWQNLFHSAPLRAPMALTLSGATGFLAERVRHTTPGIAPTIGGISELSAVDEFLHQGRLLVLFDDILNLAAQRLIVKDHTFSRNPETSVFMEGLDDDRKDIPLYWA